MQIATSLLQIAYWIVFVLFPISEWVIIVYYRYVKSPIFTLCVGNAWGEAALLLAAGAKGNRSALPSSTIMIKQVSSWPVPFYFSKLSCIFPILFKSFFFFFCWKAGKSVVMLITYTRLLFIFNMNIVLSSCQCAANCKVSRPGNRCGPCKKRSEECEGRVGEINSQFMLHFSSAIIGHALWLLLLTKYWLAGFDYDMHWSV